MTYLSYENVLRFVYIDVLAHGFLVRWGFEAAAPATHVRMIASSRVIEEGSVEYTEEARTVALVLISEDQQISL
jgi:hypothetical protein